MAMEPINIFARIADPALVARRLRELCPAVEINGSDEDWTEAVVPFGKGKTRRTLKFMHDREYYSEPNWSTQMNGMRGYYSNFPDTERKPRVMMLTTTFAFSLATDFEPDFDPERDPRLDVVFAVAESLDGVLFTPSAMRDANGRILFGTGGEEDEDPEAVWPKVVGSVSLDEPLGAAMHDASRPKSPEEVEEAEAEADPPSPERVARRALALTAVTARAVLERDAEADFAPDTYQRFLAWIDEIGIGDELEPNEWELIQRPLGRLPQRDQINFTWRLEGLVVLAWALGRYDIPPHDQLVDLNPLWGSLGFMDTDEAKAVMTEATLRSRDELLELRNRLFAIHWRLRNYHLRPELMDFAEFARTCWFGPLDIIGLPLANGDLAIDGEQLDHIEPNALSAAHSAAQERHQAVNWLWEGPELYSDASVAT